MDFDKLMQWMEFAKKYQTNDFWNGVFDQTAFNEFMKENMDMNAPDSYQAPQASKSNFPPVDIYVTRHEIIIIADLPGYLKRKFARFCFRQPASIKRSHRTLSSQDSRLYKNDLLETLTELLNCQSLRMRIICVRNFEKWTAYSSLSQAVFPRRTYSH